MRVITADHALRGAANHSWVRKLARVGYATKGVVYMLVGGLSFQAALAGSQPEGKGGAVREIGSQPFGQVLLVLTAIGLFGYALWRVIEAATDAEHDGSDGKGLAKRAGYVISGLLHASVGVAAVQLATGSGSGQNGSASTWIGKLMEQPFGQALVVILGAGVLLFGLYQIVKGVSGKFARQLEHFRMSHRQHEFAMKVGKLGHIARGIVFGIIGTFFIKAGLDANPGEAKGMAGALAELQSKPYGGWLLAAVAIGLLCYGAWNLLLARFRQMPTA